RRAFKIRSEKDLSDILSELQLDDLARVDLAAPPDALRETFRLRVRVDEFARELVERFVFQQRFVKPCGDLLAPAVDVACALVFVAEQVVPEGEPVVGVSALVIEQTSYEDVALAGI